MKAAKILKQKKKRKEKGVKQRDARKVEIDPWSIFLYGMKAPTATEKYTSASQHSQYMDLQLGIFQ